MRIITAISFTTLLLSLACGDPAPKETQVTKQGMPDSSEAFSIIPSIQQQTDYLAVLKKPITCYTTTNGKSDSATIDIEAFKSLAASFMDKDITPFKRYYSESIFSDASTGSLTISYNAINDSFPVRSVDVLLDESTRLVKKIFIKQYLQNADTSIHEQYSWFMNQGLQVNRSVKAGNGYQLEERKEVKWGGNAAN